MLGRKSGFVDVGALGEIDDWSDAANDDGAPDDVAMIEAGERGLLIGLVGAAIGVALIVIAVWQVFA